MEIGPFSGSEREKTETVRGGCGGLNQPIRNAVPIEGHDELERENRVRKMEREHSLNGVTETVAFEVKEMIVPLKLRSYLCNANHQQII
ncbi:hypothetical protein R5R35_007670 [Gryllus longicercus]|uniref:Uncharacterized protein n=1 Tax=Gryllus longicercus TaxID=2509291 RepID=A0AAN9VHX9_9ORTH